MAQKEESLELNLLFPFRAIFAATGFRLYGIYGTLSRDLLWKNGGIKKRFLNLVNMIQLLILKFTNADFELIKC